jgi:predicted tellurium resistance membrane protein TerC
MDWIFSPESWIALVTLTALEAVLGIDNIVFISILAGKLPAAQQPRARNLGLLLAMVARILLLLSIAWIMRLTTPLFEVGGKAFAGRDLILLAGGAFLMWKGVHEIHQRVEGGGHTAPKKSAPQTMGGVLVQIALVDVVFSIDSVITAVGMANKIIIMILAIVISVAFMMVAAGSISSFIERHPTMKMLALSFLLLIGITLIADGLGQHISKGYVYFAMAFSVLVEVLNLRNRRTRRAAEATVVSTPQ